MLCALAPRLLWSQGARRCRCKLAGAVAVLRLLVTPTAALVNGTVAQWLVWSQGVSLMVPRMLDGGKLSTSRVASRAPNSLQAAIYIHRDCVDSVHNLKASIDWCRLSATSMASRAPNPRKRAAMHRMMNVFVESIVLELNALQRVGRSNLGSKSWIV